LGNLLGPALGFMESLFFGEMIPSPKAPISRLASIIKEVILSTFERFKNGFRKKSKVPELWDGKAADRIVDQLTFLSTSA